MPVQLQRAMAAEAEAARNARAKVATLRDDQHHHYHRHLQRPEVEFVTPVTPGGSVKFLPVV